MFLGREGFWICRFHRDEKAWIRDPGAFVDHGREMPNGEPALLKRREYLRRDAQSNAGWSFCCGASQPLTLLGVLRLSRDGSDLL